MNPPHGLWLRVETLTDEKNQGKFEALTTVTPTYFFPWQRIGNASARLLDQKPGPGFIMGFRPR